MTIDEDIKGIRKYLNTEANHTGWYVIIDGRIVGWYFLNFYEIVAVHDPRTKEFRFMGWDGNTLYFRTFEV
jgi:hypothetical protein